MYFIYEILEKWEMINERYEEKNSILRKKGDLLQIYWQNVPKCLCYFCRIGEIL